MTQAEFTYNLKLAREQLLEAPTCVTLGEVDFDILKEAMLASNAMFVACKEGEPWFETSKHLARLNLQHFFLNGVLVLRARSRGFGMQVL